MFEDLYKKHKAIILFSIVSSIVFLLLFASYWGAGSHIRKYYHKVIYPIQNIWSGTTDKVALQMGALSEIQRLQDELAETRQVLLKQQNMAQELELIRKEKEDLEALLGYKKSLDLRTVPARIIAKDPESLFPTIIINKGTEDGVKSGMAVLGFNHGQAALVGNVMEVSAKSSKIQTVYDSRCEVSIMIEDTSDIGILKGRIPQDYRCLAEYIDRRVEKLEGKNVITSGLGDKYPKGIYVGCIIEVERKRYGLFQKAFIEPYINYFTLEYVFVITRK